MVFVDGSLTVVVIGDWNRIYSKPEWIAKEIFDANEMNIKVDGWGNNFKLYFEKDNVVIIPKQERVTFRALNLKDNTLEYFIGCINNYLNKAQTPKLTAYGLNIDLHDDDSNVFADEIDQMRDINPLIEAGYEILDTRIEREIKKDDTGKIQMIVDLNKDGTLKLHINEEYQEKEWKPIDLDFIKKYFRHCREIAACLGYTVKEDFDEK